MVVAVVMESVGKESTEQRSFFKKKKSGGRAVEVKGDADGVKTYLPEFVVCLLVA